MKKTPLMDYLREIMNELHGQDNGKFLMISRVRQHFGNMLEDFTVNNLDEVKAKTEEIIQRTDLTNAESELIAFITDRMIV